jgi:3'-phosphoadenosine 5'-phosphosulfate sulfotransferase (PAPS reductase)/FAD synthetase
MKPKLAISFSGGRTSAVMLKQCLDRFTESHEIVITFANTGQEDERTLDFVNAVDLNFCRPVGREVVWLEAEAHEQGVGQTAKIVTYETASRDGKPFEDAIAKYGVFNTKYPNCTGRLKDEPIHSYLRSIGWKRGTYDTAIGIRADEKIRISKDAEKKRFIYPLVEWGWRKRDVNEYMAQFDWDLKIPNDAYGNCTWCWKKSKRKLMTVAKSNPDAFDFAGRMERKYGMINKGESEMTEPRTFFRGNLSAQDILKAAFTQQFTPYEDDTFDQMEFFDELLDAGGSCSSSCEIGADNK